MNTDTRFLERVFLIVFLVLMALPGLALAQPAITSLTFTPALIDTSAGPADVTVNFTVTFTPSNYYFETAFVDSVGTIHRQSKTTASGTDSVVITFPQFSPQGTWKIAYVFVADSIGTLFLDSAGVSAAFPSLGTLQVSSVADSTPPNITGFTFTPSINTTSGPADVTVNFTLTDDLAINSGSVYVGFIGPSGKTRGNTYTVPASPAITSKTDSMTISFPKFAEQGTWKVSFIIVTDAAGNTLVLDPTGALGTYPSGFASVLTVTSATDNTPPNITVFSFTPASITTTSQAQDVTVHFTVSDDAAGVSSVYAAFISPSGQTTRGTTVNSGDPDFALNQLKINFPKLSEAGTWKVSLIIVTDAAGNALLLDTAAAAGPPYNFATNLEVITIPDTQAPSLTPGISLTPSLIGSGGGNVTVHFTVTDDASGVNTFQIVFRSPSGNQSRSGAISFPAAGSVTSAAVVAFPPNSEPGTWTVSSVFLADLAGNTRICTGIVETGCPALPTLEVSATPVDTTPPVIIPIVSPSPNSAGWNNTAAIVSWSVTDSESPITSTTGCGMTTLNSTPPAGTLLTCSATSTGGTSIGSVLVKIDATAPVTSSVVATPSPVPATSPLTITATVTDSGGSNVVSAEYNIDGGAFDDLAATDGAFDSSTENMSLTLPITHPLLVAGGVHTFCIRGTDGADNVGATACVTVTIAAHAPPPPEHFGVFVGLRNSDDQGTNFDLQVEVLDNNAVVATGLTRCIAGVTRNQNLAKEVSVALDPLTVLSGHVLSFRISTRIGTNPDDTKCDGHNNATGLRLYYDSTSQPSQVIAEITPAPPASFFLHTTGSSNFFDTTAPTATTANSKDSASVNFAGGNPFKVIGTWSRTQP